MSLTSDELGRAISSLKWILAGALLITIDVTVSNATQTPVLSSGSFSGDFVERGWRFDFFDDALGWLIVLVGLGRLAPIPVGRAYTRTMKTLFAVGVLATVMAIHDHFVYPVPSWVDWLRTGIALAGAFSTLAFSLAMIALARAGDLPRAARDWLVEAVYVFLIYICPVAGAIAAPLLGLRIDFRTDDARALVAFMALVLLPLLWFFAALVRMKSEASFRRRALARRERRGELARDAAG